MYVLYRLLYQGYIYKIHNFSNKFVFALNLLQQVRISNAASSLMTPLLVQRRPLCSDSTLPYYVSLSFGAFSKVKAAEAL